jgi:hypothetical protein
MLAMPSVLHEVLRELFAKRPDLLAPLLVERLSLPSPGLVALDSEQTDARLKQLLPDAVLACPNAHAPALVMIVEVHLQTDEVKRRVWPQYAATAHARHRCPVVVVVVTPSSRVERWASRPIEIGPRHTMTPEVLGPSALPRLDAAAVRRAPVVGMLSTLAHTGDPDCAEQALETLDALASWDEDADGRLADILEAALPAAVRARMEELMRTGKYEYQSELAKKYIARGREEGLEKGREEGLEKGREEGLEKGLEKGREEGREEGRAVGEARALLLVLRSRAVDVPPEATRRIEEERDGARLEVWIRRAATAASIDDVFADE